MYQVSEGLGFNFSGSGPGILTVVESDEDDDFQSGLYSNYEILQSGKRPPPTAPKSTPSINTRTHSILSTTTRSQSIASNLTRTQSARTQPPRKLQPRKLTSRQQQQNPKIFRVTDHKTATSKQKTSIEDAENQILVVKSIAERNGLPAASILPDKSTRTGSLGVRSVRNRNDISRQDELSHWNGWGGDLGVPYMNSLCTLIDRYMGLETDDQLCYVCSSKESDIYGCDSEGERLIKMIRSRYVLVEPVTLVNADRGFKVIGDYRHLQEQPSSQQVHIGGLDQRLSNHESVVSDDDELQRNMTVEDFFQRISMQKPQHNKIILHDVLPSLPDLQTTLLTIAKCLQPKGRLLIIHRPGPPLNTLPLPRLALEALGALDTPVAHIMELLREQGMHVSCEIEHLQVTIPTQKCLYLVDKKFPPPLQRLQQYNRDAVDQGLDELRQGAFRYAEPWVQFTDRLFFISAFYKHCSPFTFKKPSPSLSEFISARPLAPIYGRVVPQDNRRINVANEPCFKTPTIVDSKIQVDVPDEFEDYVVERRRNELKNEERRRLQEERRLQMGW